MKGFKVREFAFFIEHEESRKHLLSPLLLTEHSKHSFWVCRVCTVAPHLYAVQVFSLTYEMEGSRE